MLRAIVASIDQGDAEVDQFIELAVERASHAGVEAYKILKHLRAVGESFLDVAGLAAQRLLVDFLHFRICIFRANKGDTCHRILQDCGRTSRLIIADWHVLVHSSENKRSRKERRWTIVP